MSRAIKFRAWDSWRKEYLSAGKVMVQVLTGIRPKTPEGLHLDTSNFMCADNRMVLEQYVGFKDKNGVEIYEGDVFYDGLDHAIIEWCDASASFVANAGTEKHPLGSHTRNEEIIGNVHETSGFE